VEAYAVPGRRSARLIHAFRIRRAVCFLSLFATRSAAQDTSPLRIAGLEVRGSLRCRAENWNWFDAPPSRSLYTYGAAVLRVSLRKSWRHLAWQAEGAVPVLLNLPADAVSPGAGGPLGYGADYFQANGQRNLGTGVLRQAFLEIKGTGDQPRLRAGRFEFADGAESVPPDPDLAAFKRDRINQRLIAAFNYALRSYDGAQFVWQNGPSNVAVAAMRLVEGSFQLRALHQIKLMRNSPMARTRKTLHPRNCTVNSGSSACGIRIAAMLRRPIIARRKLPRRIGISFV
jgi:hypothetical protein